MARFRFRTGWHFHHMSVGARLRLAFGCVMLLMFAGSGLALWNLRSVRTNVERTSVVEQRIIAVLRFDNSVLSLMSQLHRAADTRRREHFEAEAARLLANFRKDSAWASGALRRIAVQNDVQAVMIDSLSALLDALPGRVESLIELARAGDWMAVHGRLLNEVDQTDIVVAQLVRELRRNLAETRRQLLDEIEQAERNAGRGLALAGLLSLLAAALLGFSVTRSIARPLAALDAGARALARGEFETTVPVTGNDELAQLATVFNQTASELQDLYSKIRLSEAHFRSLIENAADLIMVISGTGRILYASPSSARVLGYSPAALAGQPIRDLFSDDEAPVSHPLFAGNGPVVAGSQSFELRFRHRDGSVRTLEGIATDLLADPAVGGIVVNARDISRRREAEQALREQEQRLLEAQKMEAVGHLAAGVAHDFNNLLTVILGTASLAQHSAASPEEITSALARIREAAQNAATLTSQLLAYAGKGDFVIEPVDLSRVVADCTALVRASIPASVELEIALAPRLPCLAADRRQLRQAIMNLVLNAAEAIDDRRPGRIRIRTAEGPRQNTGRTLVLSIEDNGCGMDEATLAKVFDPFFTTKFLGRGLGLSAVAGIVRTLGGTIHATSAPGAGSTFTIELPAARE